MAKEKKGVENKKIKILAALLYGALAFLWVFFIFTGYKLGVQKSLFSEDSFSEKKQDGIPPEKAAEAVMPKTSLVKTPMRGAAVEQKEIQFEALSPRLASNMKIDYEISGIFDAGEPLKPLSVSAVRPSPARIEMPEKGFEFISADTGFAGKVSTEAEDKKEAAAPEAAPASSVIEETPEIKPPESENVFPRDDIKKPEVRFTDESAVFGKEFDLRYEKSKGEQAYTAEVSPRKAEDEKLKPPEKEEKPVKALTEEKEEKPVKTFTGSNKIKLFEEAY